jgi:hypothetical protein
LDVLLVNLYGFLELLDVFGSAFAKGRLGLPVSLLSLFRSSVDLALQSATSNQQATSDQRFCPPASLPPTYRSTPAFPLGRVLPIGDVLRAVLLYIMARVHGILTLLLDTVAIGFDHLLGTG